MTLSAINERLAGRTHTWGSDPVFTMRREYAVGTSGARHRGTHTHVLLAEVVVSIDGISRGGWKPGRDFAVAALCGGNHGQHGAERHSGWDLDKVTCTKCLAALAAIGRDAK